VFFFLKKTQSKKKKKKGDSLIGTKYVRQYMHGFFMSSKLFKQMRNVANPALNEEEEKRRIDAKINSLRSSRISVQTAPQSQAKVRENFVRSFFLLICLV
jgi:ribosome biogenesis protein ENP2